MLMVPRGAWELAYTRNYHTNTMTQLEGESKLNRPVINYITHRPYTVLPKKFAGSLSRIYDLRIRTSWLNPTQESVVTLTKSFRTAVRLSSLSLNSVVPYKHVFLDSMDSLVVWPALCKSIVLEYSTCLPAELAWLGYPRLLVEQARRTEAFVLTHSSLITTPNELFMKHEIARRKELLHDT